MFFKPFPLPKEPTVPDYTVSVTDFGAVADGKTGCKAAFDAAIASVKEKGGGHVTVPAGEYFCDGPIHFCSNMDLHLEEGATVNFTDECEKYLPVVYTRIEGILCYNYSPLIYGIDLENVSITGKGTFNGNGFAWWDMKVKEYSSGCGSVTNALYAMGQNETPVEERVFGRREDCLRPCFLQFVRCKNILIENVRFEHSPFWTVAPIFSENIIVRGIRLFSERWGRNTDGINMDSCRNCLIEHCTVYSSSDDAFCVKSGRDRDGMRVGIPTENVLFRHCRVFNGSGCVAVGSETSGGIRNVCYHDIEIATAGNVINIKSAPGRGNVIRDVDIYNIHCKLSLGSVNIIKKYFVKGEVELKDMPEIENIYIENVRVDNCWKGLTLSTYKESPIRNAFLRNVDISAVDYSQLIENVDDLILENVHTRRSMDVFDWRIPCCGPWQKEMPLPDPVEE